MKSISVDQVNFDLTGLVPAIVQDVDSKRVLMLAYQNREALELTLETGVATFWSRSRQEIWVKGATSGNTQHVQSIEVDCDSDAILLQVHASGPACHNGTTSCFDTAKLKDLGDAEL